MAKSDDAVASIFGGGKDDPVELPSQKAENVSRTAPALEQGTEASRKRRRAQAGVFNAGNPAQLSQPGLLGLGQR